jgi:hypothetical protein
MSKINHKNGGEEGDLKKLEEQGLIDANDQKIGEIYQDS